MATAATIGLKNPNASLNTVGHIAHAFVPFLGERMGVVVFSIGILGAGMVAAIVVSLAAAWGFGEVTGYKHSLEYHPKEAPWFYVVYTLAVVAGALAVVAIPNLVSLTVAVEVMNSCLLPMVLGFLVALAVKALPLEHRLRGWYFWVVVAISTLSAGLGVYGGLTSIPGSGW
ncbi:divalent metal cation transporter [Acidithiobacillus ferrianus]|uniref:divalent metal cation transporter n=1 Tax=Acidithiobacillus ferrianus TaxID=2678518 RepID=UPI0034E49110